MIKNIIQNVVVIKKGRKSLDKKFDFVIINVDSYYFF